MFEDRKFTGMVMVLALGWIVSLVWALQTAPPKPNVQRLDMAEKAPTPERSLEKIDHLGGFSDPDVYLYRALSCYYIVVMSAGRSSVVHVESCPSPVHQKPQVLSRGIGLPTNSTSGDVLKDLSPKSK